MGERWLYGVDGGLLEPEDEWGRDPWLDGVPPPRDAGRAPGGLGTVTEVVLIDGHVVDSVSRPVSGSGYECAALELAHLRPPPPQPRVERVVVREEPQEQMLHWLGRVLGDAAALDALDDRPLPLREPLQVDLLSSRDRELARVIDEHLDLTGRPVVGDELLTAYRRLVVRAAHEGMLRHWQDVDPAVVTAAIVHCVIKANALSGTGAPFSVATFLGDLAVTNPPISRSRSLAVLVGGTQWPHGRSPSEAPGVYVLGDEQFLVSRFRNELITYRDLARRAEAASGQVTTD